MKKILVYGLSNEWGGVEAIVMAMVQHLAGNCMFDIIHSLAPSSYEEKYQSDYIRFVHIPAWGSDRKGFASSLKLLFHEKKYDYVWINGCLMANRTIVSVTKKYSEAKIITHSHGSSFEERNKLKRFILFALHIMNRSYYRANVDYPCMCSQKSGLWFYGEDYMNSHTVHYIKNGVDVNKYRFDKNTRDIYRKELGLVNELALFHAGRLTVVKNQRRILSIFADLLLTGVKAKLFVAGDGELKEELEALTKSLGIEEFVCFLGKRNDVNNLYQAMDVMLLPSFHEGFPVTLTEAQASGLPCLVSDRVSEETNISGLVKYFSIDVESNKEWVDAIVELANNPIAKRENYAKLLCEEGYDVSIVCDNFLEFIEVQQN